MTDDKAFNSALFDGSLGSVSAFILLNEYMFSLVSWNTGLVMAVIHVLNLVPFVCSSSLHFPSPLSSFPVLLSSSPIENWSFLVDQLQSAAIQGSSISFRTENPGFCLMSTFPDLSYMHLVTAPMSACVLLGGHSNLLFLFIESKLHANRTVLND